jgi:formylglycine-generating enzyme required for sulfatase activity
MKKNTLAKAFALGMLEGNSRRLFEQAYATSNTPKLSLIEAKGIGSRWSEISIYCSNAPSMIRCPEQIESVEPNGNKTDKHNILMSETEVTQGQFEAVMGYNPSEFQILDGSSHLRPVEDVSWFDCILFCNLLSLQKGFKPYYKMSIKERRPKWPFWITAADVEIIGGNGFRLPAKAEWLLFAKAGTNNELSGISDPNDLPRVAWFSENSNYTTHPVAQLLPNEWGLYDMTGNVIEWCWDEASYAGPKKEYRVALGGSRNDTPVSFTEFNKPSRMLYGEEEANRIGKFKPSNHMSALGFRICQYINS